MVFHNQMRDLSSWCCKCGLHAWQLGGCLSQVCCSLLECRVAPRSANLAGHRRGRLASGAAREGHLVPGFCGEVRGVVMLNPVHARLSDPL